MAKAEGELVITIGHKSDGRKEAQVVGTLVHAYSVRSSKDAWELCTRVLLMHKHVM